MGEKVCRCGQRLIMAATAAGNTMPVNAEPNADGTVALWQDAAGGYSCRVISVSQPRRPGEVMHVSHFVTCPYADEKRRTRPPRTAPRKLSRDPGLRPLF